MTMTLSKTNLPLILAQNKRFEAKKPYGLMGIVNVTPDSFYTSVQTTTDALNLSLKQEESGADIIDIGAESSRPYAEPLTSSQELARLMPVIVALKAAKPKLLISVDTYHAATAAKVLEAGVDLINDISACHFEPELLDVLGQYKPGYVLMHSQGRPKEMQKAPTYKDVVAEVQSFFDHELTRLTKAGLPEEHIILDPGIGFGKLLEHNLTLLKQINVLQTFNRPLLVGLSMKSMFADLLGLQTNERGEATRVAIACLYERGVFWHRVHDVAKAKEALELTCALL